MAKKSKYYKQLNSDMHDVYAERNILRAERDNARKSVSAMKKKVDDAYADINRREAELREKELLSADERMRIKYEDMRSRYMGIKNELRRYRVTIAKIDQSGEHQDVVEMFKEVGWNGGKAKSERQKAGGSQ